MGVDYYFNPPSPPDEQNERVLLIEDEVLRLNFMMGIFSGLAIRNPSPRLNEIVTLLSSAHYLMNEELRERRQRIKP